MNMKQVTRHLLFFLQEPDFVVRKSKEFSPNFKGWSFAYEGTSLVASGHQVCLNHGTWKEDYTCGEEKGKAHVVGQVGEG